jgi:hypothetical protein
MDRASSRDSGRNTVSNVQRASAGYQLSIYAQRVCGWVFVIVACEGLE